MPYPRWMGSSDESSRAYKDTLLSHHPHSSDRTIVLATQIVIRYPQAYSNVPLLDRAQRSKANATSLVVSSRTQPASCVACTLGCQPSWPLLSLRSLCQPPTLKMMVSLIAGLLEVRLSFTHFNNFAHVILIHFLAPCNSRNDCCLGLICDARPVFGLLGQVCNVDPIPGK